MVIDGGRSATRNWNSNEIQYIQNMCAGFRNIEFTVIRARIEKNPPQIEIQTIPLREQPTKGQ